MSFIWKKLGKIFDPKDAGLPWINSHAQAPATLIFKDFVRVYFSTRPPADESGQFVSLAAFVDLSRKDLTKILRISQKPILPLGERGTFDEFGTYPISVIKDEDNTFKAYYGGWTRPESVPFDVAIGLAESSDGENFKKIGKGGPVLAASKYEPFILSGPKIRRFENQWHLFYIAGEKWIKTDLRPEPVYKIRHATSSNGIDWNKTNFDLLPVPLSEKECQASPDVIFRNGKYHMFYCYRKSLDYKTKANSYRIGYAQAENPIYWTREDEKVGIDVSDSGWDSEMISYPHVFELDNKIYMMYLGNDFGKDGFGLAELEGDL